MRKVYHAAQQDVIQLPLFELTRICNKCTPPTEKPIEEFTGRNHMCKECQRAYSHNHYVANREKRLAQCKEYRTNNKERVAAHDRERNQRPERKARRNELARKYNRTERRRAYNRKWLHEHRAGNPKWQAYDRQRYYKHHETMKARLRARYLNPNFRAYKRAYDATHPEQARAQAERKRLRYASDSELRKLRVYTSKAWRKANPEKFFASLRRREARKKHAHVIEKVNYQRILEQWGHFCYICEQPILPHQRLTFDHVVPLQPRPGQPKGEHTEENLRPTHHVCNCRKSNKRLEDLTPFDRRGPDC